MNMSLSRSSAVKPSAQFPLITIMMPAYNAANYIGEAVNSVLEQSYPNWELIVVDDGSADKTAEILQAIDDERIRIINQANQGEAAARNRALEAMQGEYLGFLDADDRFQPNHIEHALEFLERSPKLSAVYTDGYKIDEAGDMIGLLSDDRRGPFSGDIFEQVLRASDVFGPPICVVIRSSLIRSNNLRFDPKIVIGPDWDFLLRVAELGNFGYLDQPTCDYRIHQTNISFTTDIEKRKQSLARCRTRAIWNRRFSHCSLETRSYAFYDLLVNHLLGYPEKQHEVLHWQPFVSLPEEARSRIIQLMASKSIAYGVDEKIVQGWLEKAIELARFNLKAQSLYFLTKLAPKLSRTILSRRYPLSRENHLKSSPGGAYSAE